MSAPVTAPATTGTDRSGTVPAARAGDVDGPSGRDSAPGRAGAPGRPVSAAVVVLVSVILSVAASLSLVAFTDVGASASRPAPAAVAEPDPGDGAAEPGAVEEGARTTLENYGYTRGGSFCPTSSYPPAAC